MPRRKKRKVKKTRKKKSRSIKNTRKKKSRKINKSKKRKSKKIKRTKKQKKLKSLIQSKDSEGNTLIKVSDNWASHAYVNDSKYKKKYKLSIKENDKFWAREGKRITWMKKYTKIKDVKYSKEEVKIKS